MIRNRVAEDREDVAVAVEQRWSVYLLKTDRDTLYTGISTDVSRRLRQHLSGQGARCLRGASSLTLVWQMPVENHSQALRCERLIKALSPARKRHLVDHVADRSTLLNTLGLSAAE